MRYLSVCSGIEAASVAWHGLGWEPAVFSDIEAFPRALLRHHYPQVPLHGRDRRAGEDFGDYAADAGFQTIRGDEYGTIDLLVGGTPCQSFSIAGLRGGLGDDRGNLALEYLRLADRARPRWLVWENVPGVLSSNGGRDFGAILGGMVELGYGVAYRVLDAQHFGVPQRRRRVFAVGYFGDWRRAAAVLFERHSLSGHPAPRREKRQGIAGGFEVGPLGGSFTELAPTLDTRCKDGPVRNQLGAGVIDWPAERAATLNAHFGDKMQIAHCADVAGCMPHQAHGGVDTQSALSGYLVAQPVAYSIMPMNSGKDYKARETDVAQPIMAGGPVGGNQGGDYIAEPVAFAQGDYASSAFEQVDQSSPITTSADRTRAAPIAIQAGATRENPASGPDGVGVRDDGLAYTLEARAEVQAVAFADCYNGPLGDTAATLTTGSGLSAGAAGPSVLTEYAVRRLTPRECERLQGFPDDYTLVPFRGKPASDGPRYKALGNSMAVPVMRWIGERIALVDALEGEA